MKLLCYFLIFSFLLLSPLQLSATVGQKPGPVTNTNTTTTPTPTEEHTTTTPIPQTAEAPIQCDCIDTCDEISILGKLYSRLLYEKEDGLGHAKRILDEIQGWVETWEDKSGRTQPNVQATTTLTQKSQTITKVTSEHEHTEPTNDSIVTNTTAPAPTTTIPSDVPSTSTPPLPNSITTEQPPIEIATIRTVQTGKTDDGHFYQSTFFFVLIFFSIMIVFSIYFCYISRRKVSYL